MKRSILIMVLGSMLAVAGLALGSDTASRSASDCPFPCGPCPVSCTAQGAASAMGGCPSSCPLAPAN